LSSKRRVNAIKLRDIVGWVERKRNPPLLEISKVWWVALCSTHPTKNLNLMALKRRVRPTHPYKY